MPELRQQGFVQPINQENCDAAFALHQQCHTNPWSKSAFVDCLQDQYFGLQCLLDDKLVAYCIGLNVVGEVTLMDIGVDAMYQGLGLGRQMLNHFLSHALFIGGEEVWLEVRQSNQRAIALYASSGFELIETRKNYYKISSTPSGQANATEDALIMKKTL